MSKEIQCRRRANEKGVEKELYLQLRGNTTGSSKKHEEEI